MWFGRDGKKWTDQDRLITLAFTMHEEAMCPGCGQPKDQAYNPDAEGWYEAHEVICAGCKAQQEHSAAKKEPTPGAKVFTSADPQMGELKPWRLSAQLEHDPGDEQGDAE